MRQPFGMLVLAAVLFPNPACATTGRHVFFPVTEQCEAAAKAVCTACPSLDACQRWALTQTGLRGVWAGMNETERARDMRLQIGRAKRARAHKDRRAKPRLRFGTYGEYRSTDPRSVIVDQHMGVTA